MQIENGTTYDAFAAQLLRQVAGRGEASVKVVFDRWAKESETEESFLAYLATRGVIDRVGARAVAHAWAGRLDLQDARQVFDPAALARGLNRLAADGPPAPGAAIEYRAIGTRIGRYAIKGVLGRGGCGPVYLSVHPTLRIPVAVKVVGGASAARDALWAEARRQASINHPNVVRVWDFEDGEEAILVTEYVPGENLRDRLRAGPLDRHEGFSLLIQVAAGLRAAHALGVTHHDIKPANILLDADDRYKIGDFGLSRCRRRFARVTTDGPKALPQIAGTWAYTAPEQFEAHADHRADMYSLGLTVYHALTGRPALDDTDPDALMQRHKRGGFDPMHRAAPGAGWAVSDLVARMTAVDPAHRFATYDELIRAAESAFDLRMETY